MVFAKYDIPRFCAQAPQPGIGKRENLRSEVTEACNNVRHICAACICYLRYITILAIADAACAQRKHCTRLVDMLGLGCHSRLNFRLRHIGRLKRIVTGYSIGAVDQLSAVFNALDGLSASTADAQDKRQGRPN